MDSLFLHAFLMCILASIAAGLVGSYVVVKRLSYVSGSVAHGAFGGIGLATFLGVNPLIGASAFACLTAAFVSLARTKAPEHEDALIGTIWSIGMAVGLIFIHFSSGYTGDLFSYLFGNILLTTSFDLWLVAGLDLFLILCMAILYRPLQALTFDEDYAEILNIPVRYLMMFLFVLIAFTSVVLLQAVGIILVITLLTLPAASAWLLTQCLKKLQALAVLFSALSSLVGLYLSIMFDLPSGPSIILATVAIYAACFIWKRLLKNY
jgi:zinc transport system permease protein